MLTQEEIQDLVEEANELTEKIERLDRIGAKEEATRLERIREIAKQRGELWDKIQEAQWERNEALANEKKEYMAKFVSKIK